MAYLKTILTIQDPKKFWVLKIIDLQQGKHLSNHHTGVESKEQIVGIQFQLSQTILFRDIWREYDEPNVKPRSTTEPDITGWCDPSPSLRHIRDHDD